MKFKDLFIFLEQEDDELDIDPMPNWQPDDDEPDQPADNDEIPDDEDWDQPLEPNQPDQRPDVPRKLSATQEVKKRWKEENPGLTDFQIDDAIGFFRQRKDALRPYHPYGYIDPQTQRHYINIPEITSIVMRFPQMEPILSKNDQMKDLRNYPWEVMEFYIDIVRANNAAIDEENLVPGTRLPFEEQLSLAKQKWEEPRNQIVNEGGVKVYKIESKFESIKYGSIQRILNLKRREEGNSRGNIYWCTTVPVTDRGRSNLWTNYRPEYGFYYIWDSNRNETDEQYCGSIQAAQNGTYTFVDLYNHTTTSLPWASIVAMYPVLGNKQNLFPWFGITSKEREDLTIDKISMQEGHKYYFGTVPEAYQNAYVDSGRHVNDVKAFLTMRPATRKLYVDKTTKENNDLQTRFLCNDPANQYGILEILRLQTKPENLYKYLDGKILKTNLQIPEGILAIKKLILGDNFDRWLSDDEKGYTLIRKRPEGGARGRDALRNKMGIPYGVIDTNTAEVVKETSYAPQLPRPYLKPYMNEEGKLMRDKQFILQKFLYKTGDGNVDQSEGFYMFYPKEAVAKPKNGEASNMYLKGTYFDLAEGDEYIRSKTATGELVKI